MMWSLFWNFDNLVFSFLTLYDKLVFWKMMRLGSSEEGGSGSGGDVAEVGGDCDWGCW